MAGKEITRLDVSILEAAEPVPRRCRARRGAETTSYANLADLVCSVADEIRAAGPRSAAVIVPVSNRASDFVSQIASWRQGLVVVPVHRGTPRARVEAILQQCGARMLVGVDVPAHWSELFEPIGTEAWTWTVAGSPSGPRLHRRSVRNRRWSCSPRLHRPAQGVVLSHAAFVGKLAAIEKVLPFGAARTHCNCCSCTSASAMDLAADSGIGWNAATQGAVPGRLTCCAALSNSTSHRSGWCPRWPG